METVNERLYHFKETPPPEIWDKISNRLAGDRVIKLNSRRKTRLLAFISAAAAVIALLIINFLFLNKSPDHSTAEMLGKIDSNYMEKNNELLEAIINTPVNKKLAEVNNIAADGFMKYFTVRGPEGEPVKISPKVATLIISADNEYPPKPVWDKKISEWQRIMLSNNISPTPANLIEIIEQASNTLR